MAYGKAMQIEKQLDYDLDSKRRLVQHSHRWDKLIKHRIERRRVKQDIECQPQYNRYDGYEW